MKSTVLHHDKLRQLCCESAAFVYLKSRDTNLKTKLNSELKTPSYVFPHVMVIPLKSLFQKELFCVGFLNQEFK